MKPEPRPSPDKPGAPDARTRADSLAMHSGDYVAMYERKPISRVSRLVPLMKLSGKTRLVDFACGNAMLLEAAGDRVGHYTGVDFSADFIAAARRRAATIPGTPVQLYCQDIVGFCREHPGQFDVAAALDFTEHVRDEELLPILRAIRSSLVDGGKFYLHTPNLDFFLERMRESGFLLRQRPEHVAVRNLRQNLALLEEAGFSRSGTTAWMLPHYNILRSLHGLGRLPLVGRYFQARIFIECTA